jgi:hypothetical protein
MSVISAGSRTRGAPKVPLRQHARGSANLRPRICRMIWLQLYRTDIARDKQPRPGASSLNLLFTEQGLWALLEHRIASGVYNDRCPTSSNAHVFTHWKEVWQKVVEVLTGTLKPASGLASRLGMWGRSSPERTPSALQRFRKA